MGRAGGTGSAGDKSSDLEIQAYLRTLIEGGVLPPSAPARMRAGWYSESYGCTACGVMISVGDIQYEWTNPTATVLHFHAHCVDLYRRFRE